MEDEVGVPTFELLGERESEPPRVVPCDDGDAVPDVESFFFEDLSLSFVLDSCSCWTIVSNSHQNTIQLVESTRHALVNRNPNQLTTLCLKPFILRQQACSRSWNCVQAQPALSFVGEGVRSTAGFCMGSVRIRGR